MTRMWFIMEDNGHNLHGLGYTMYNWNNLHTNIQGCNTCIMFLYKTDTHNVYNKGMICSKNVYKYTIKNQNYSCFW